MTLSLSFCIHVCLARLQCNVGTNKNSMTCAQCGRACFLAGCGGGERRSCGGGCVWRGGGEGVCVGGGDNFKIFVRGVQLKPLKYDDPFYNSKRTSFRPIFIILIKFSIQIYIF